MGFSPPTGCPGWEPGGVETSLAVLSIVCLWVTSDLRVHLGKARSGSGGGLCLVPEPSGPSGQDGPPQGSSPKTSVLAGTPCPPPTVSPLQLKCSPRSPRSPRCPRAYPLQRGPAHCCSLHRFTSAVSTPGRPWNVYSLGNSQSALKMQ